MIDSFAGRCGKGSYARINSKRREVMLMGIYIVATLLGWLVITAACAATLMTRRVWSGRQRNYVYASLMR